MNEQPNSKHRLVFTITSHDNANTVEVSMVLPFYEIPYMIRKIMANGGEVKEVKCLI